MTARTDFMAIPEAFIPIDGATDLDLRDSFNQALWLSRACVVALATMPMRVESGTDDARDAFAFLAAELFDQIEAKVFELHRRHASAAA